MASLERLYVSTGHLPDPEMVQSLVEDAHRRFKSNSDGKNSLAGDVGSLRGTTQNLARGRLLISGLVRILIGISHWRQSGWIMLASGAFGVLVGPAQRDNVNLAPCAIGGDQSCQV
jgi:hypothetical protein